MEEKVDGRSCLAEKVVFGEYICKNVSVRSGQRSFLKKFFIIFGNLVIFKFPESQHNTRPDPRK